MSSSNLPSSPQQGNDNTALTVADAFQSNSSALATIAKEKGLHIAQAALRIRFSVFASQLHIKDTLTAEDIDFIVEQLTADDNYRWLKMADLELLFKRIRMNRYGNLYQSMNTGKFFECLDKYCIERNGEIENINVKEANTRKIDMPDFSDLPYTISPDGKIVPKPKKEEPKKKNNANEQQQANVASLVRNFVSEGMGYLEAMQRAIEKVENIEQQPANNDYFPQI